MTVRARLAAIVLLLLAVPATAQPLSRSEQARIDALVTRVLAESKVPSASIALVRDGRIVLAKAYGRASPAIAQARADLPYQIASNSKQFTAMALLALENDGKLDLDDKVAKWLPGISGGDRIALRQLLSHTAGLPDYWPQDYMIPAMRVPVQPLDIVDRWARRPLDYEPGTRRQYSNTGYVVAGLVAEKAAGMPLMTYLQSRIFTPLGMRPVQIDDSNRPGFPAGHHRHVTGPVRVATPPARGWLYAAGDLSMTAADLARWNIARLERRLLPAEDWAAQETPVRLADGTSTGYGLGVSIGTSGGRRFINHGGESVGFLSQNTVYPDDRAAITVLTNADFGHIEGTLIDALASILLPRVAAADPGEPDRTADARTLLAALAAGTLDPATLTTNARDYFSHTTRADYRASLAPLGPISSIVLLGTPRLRGGFVNRRFRIVAGGRGFTVNSYAEPGAAGRWEQFIVSPE
jgi:CubicO group peptidase (beta-lactamase class C family)